MTAAVTAPGGHIRAPRPARFRAGAGLLYVGGIASITIARATSFMYIVRHGEAAAARGVVLSMAFLLLALLVAAIRTARLAVDDDGLRWGWGSLGFSLPRRKVAAARVHDDAVAMVLTRGSTWFLSARDYTPYVDLVSALRRAGLPVEHVPGRAPLRARLQAYGVALDLILVVAILGVTAVFLAS